jgi:predicted phosphoribosyltransferase
VRDTFRIELPLDSLFASPTVAGLAERIVADQLTPEEREEIEQLYREISDLSSEEARERLARELRAEEGGD